jgi:hypothetical protein
VGSKSDHNCLLCFIITLLHLVLWPHIQSSRFWSGRVLFYSTISQYLSREIEENQGQLSVRITGPRKKTWNPPNKKSKDHGNWSVWPCDRNSTCARQAADCFLASCRELTTNSLFIKHHTFCNLSNVRCQFNNNTPDNIVSRLRLIVSIVIFAPSGTLVSIPARFFMKGPAADATGAPQP